jgi:hypothetical protein
VFAQLHFRLDFTVIHSPKPVDVAKFDEPTTQAPELIELQRWFVRHKDDTTQGAQMRQQCHRAKNVYGQSRVATRSRPTRMRLRRRNCIIGSEPTVIQCEKGRRLSCCSEYMLVRWRDDPLVKEQAAQGYWRSRMETLFQRIGDTLRLFCNRLALPGMDAPQYRR